MNGGRACAGQLETKSGLCPDDIPLRGTKSTLRVDEICELVLADDEFQGVTFFACPDETGGVEWQAVQPT